MIIRSKVVQAFDFSGLEIVDYTANCDQKSSFAVIKVKPDANH